MNPQKLAVLLMVLSTVINSTGGLLVRIHNIGSKPVRGVEVAAYNGDPDNGGKLIGLKRIPNIAAPIDLNPATMTIGFGWQPKPGETYDIHVVIDPDSKMETEITTFNNKANATITGGIE